MVDTGRHMYQEKAFQYSVYPWESLYCMWLVTECHLEELPSGKRLSKKQLKGALTVRWRNSDSMLLIIWLTGGNAPGQWLATTDIIGKPMSHWPGSQQNQELQHPEQHPGLKGCLPSSFKRSSVFISHSRASLTDGIRTLTSRAITSSATDTKEQGL